MSQRTERVAGELRAIIGEAIARREIKDPRVQGAGLITITHVRMSGDLRQAWALFTVHNAGDAELEHVREGLDRASGFLRHAIARRLRLKVTPTLNFEIDRVFEQASRVEHLLHQIASSAPPKTEGGEQSTDGGEQSADGDGAGASDDDQQRE